jgi:phosphoglycerate kinase
MGKLLLQDLPLQGKKLLIRVDFNVPLKKDGSIADDTRILESLPTIQSALNQGAAVILMSHLGRPKSKADLQFSLGICAKRLSQLLSAPVFFATDCIGKEVEKKVADLKGGEVLLLENLRFYPAEEKPDSDPVFARELSKLADYYVNDAFGTAHRAHSSTVTITQFFPSKAAAGLLLQKEISHLTPLVTHPVRPFFAIIGGAKISTKIGVLRSLLSKVDQIFIGGAMAYTFFKAQGLSTGDSPVEDSQLPIARQFLESCGLSGVKLHLPTDLVIADSFSDKANSKIISIGQGVPDGWQGMDIGPETAAQWTSLFSSAKTILWNGPVGVFEFPLFAKGTEEIAQSLSRLSSVTTIVGGGDSVAAVAQLGLKQKFTHVSTGGGASLEFLEFGHLPGIDALSDKI